MSVQLAELVLGGGALLFLFMKMGSSDAPKQSDAGDAEGDIRRSGADQKGAINEDPQTQRPEVVSGTGQSIHQGEFANLHVQGGTTDKISNLKPGAGNNAPHQPTASSTPLSSETKNHEPSCEEFKNQSVNGRPRWHYMHGKQKTGPCKGVDFPF